jgi:hypothetical protein
LIGIRILPQGDVSARLCKPVSLPSILKMRMSRKLKVCEENLYRLANRRDPPGIGEHIRDIMSEIGFTSQDIAGLGRSGAVALRPA